MAVSTTLTVETTGAPANNGFGASGQSWTNNDPILETNLFDDGPDITTALGVTVTNLASLDAGSVITVTAWGIGDNEGQDTTITADFGGSTQSGNTVFNTVSSNRGDSTGSVPYQQFTYIADGTNDLLTVTLQAGPGSFGDGTFANQNRSHFNGFSISVTPVPEPSSIVLLGFTGGLLLKRRRRA